MPNPRTQAAPWFMKDVIDELNDVNLMVRLVIGIKRMELSTAESNELLAKLPAAVDEFMANDDHGLVHSLRVIERSKELLAACPNVRRLATSWQRPENLDAMLNWAAILHDFARFLGPGYNDLKQHQVFDATLAFACFEQETEFTVTNCLAQMIAHHDYICEAFDHEPLPFILISNPLADLFRLADKTSLSPTDEIERYYVTGKRYGNTLFLPDWPDTERFKFDIATITEWDQTNYFMPFFTLSPRDWFAHELAQQYREWAEQPDCGKKEAAQKIMAFAIDSGLDLDQRAKLASLLHRFFKHFSLPDYLEHPYDHYYLS